MVNLSPLNNDPNVPEDENAPAPEHAPIDPNPSPIQPNDYLAEEEADPKEEPKEEEEPIPEQAPTAPDGGPYRLYHLSGSFLERDLRDENEILRIRLRVVEKKDEYKHMEAEYYKNHFARVSRYYDDLRGWEYRVRNRLPFKRRYRERPYDPSTNTTSRPRCDDPYVMVRDNVVCVDAASDRGGEGVNTTVVVKDAREEKGDKGDDDATAKDSRPLESYGSPRDQ
nr:hypothetical protein [Tanacetum cinerariifolium]